MRSKNYGINVRVTEQEKQKLLENARFCSLSLSEYLRRLGLGKEVRAAITERDYHLFRMLNGLKAELPQLQKEEILSRLEAILNELKYHRMTSRKNARIIEDFRDTVSAAYIARKHNISTTTALRYFNLVNYSHKALPEVLSIDEFKGNAGGEKYQTILTDARDRKIIDILPNRKKADMIRYFRRFKNRKEVKYVVIDMNPHFREVAEICFPQATIVIDRYHVTRQAIWALERVRKEEQKHLSLDWRRFCKHSKALLNKPPDKLKEDEREKLRIILGLSTRLEQAYFLKNDFLFLMHSPNSQVAKELLDDWIYRAESSHLPEFQDCTRAIHNWGQLILNSFIVPFTNGYTEGCNNKTKVLKRVCYGLRNFHRFRNRILHCAS